MSFDFGLDIGIESVGWAVINQRKCRIEDVGVRMFDAAEVPKGGSVSSLAQPRREARGARRRNRRKKHRLERIKKLFIREKMLSKSESREIFSQEVKQNHGLSPWELRVKGLDEILTSSELARALYHTAKRRGFRSNRKKAAKASEEGELLKAVHENKKIMDAKGYRTVGEMFLKDKKFNPQDPFLRHLRNKAGKYIHTVGRDEMENEVRSILKSQKKLGFEVPGNQNFSIDDFEKSFLEIMLGQRDFSMGPAKGPYSGNQILKMVGKCTFEPEEYRCAKASYSFEKFRALSSLRNIKLTSFREGDRFLEPDDIKKVFEKGLTTKKVTYKTIRKLLDLSDATAFKGLIYDDEKDPEAKEFFSLKAYHEIKKVLDKELWAKLMADENWEDRLNEIGRIFTFFKTDDDIKAELIKSGIEREYFDKLLTLDSFSGFGHLSVKALKKINPHLEQGFRYDEAWRKAYPDFKPKSGIPQRLLPIIPKEEVINPVVIRALSQSRKVLNSLIRKYGSPDRIFIELARDIKKPKSERLKLQKDMDKRRSEREKIKEEITENFGRKPSRKSDDLLKYLFYRQQEGKCAYSLKSIDLKRIFEPGYVEIDHALPYSRTFDNSQSNKVLVLTEQNRNKGNRTPFEWFGNDKKRWDEFESFIRTSQNIPYRKKQKILKKKLTEEDVKEIQERSLNDTRYIARFFKNFVSGNLIFADDGGKKKKRVFTVNGAITAFLRYRWGLAGYKNREDNVLHHALDAVVVACVNDGMIRRVSDFAKRKEFYNRRVDVGYIDPETGEVLESQYRNAREIAFPLPWENFDRETRKRIFGLNRDDEREVWLEANRFGEFKTYDEEFLKEIKPIFVSRMPKRKASGKAHDDTIRSVKYLEKNGYTVTRKKVQELKKTDLPNLLCFIKQSDRLLYEELERILNSGEKIPEEFRKPKKDGTPGPIVRSVKIASKKDKTGIPVNKGLAKNNTTVRIDVFTKKNSKGKSQNFIVPVYVPDLTNNTLPTAIKPSKKDERIDDTYDFLFSLYPNDLIQVTLGDGHKEMGYYVGFDISAGNIKYILHDTPGRTGDSLKRPGAKRIKIEKYQVDILGNYEKAGKETRQGFA